LATLVFAFLDVFTFIPESCKDCTQNSIWIREPDRLVVEMWAACCLQVSRIFIANILRARAAVANRHRADVIDDTYLLTSDADIWPIYGQVYRLPAAHDVLSLNSDCCGAFSHRNVAYRMLPMANVGMRVRTWRRLTRRFVCCPCFTSVVVHRRIPDLLVGLHSSV